MEENKTTGVWGEEVATQTAPETTEATETVAAETQPEVQAETTTEVTEPQATETETVEENEVTFASDEPVTEKVVEKIIEKYPEFENEDAKALFEAFQKGNEDDIYKYLNEKRKDYQSMSDYDVVREGLKRDNPNWTDKRLELEFKTKFDIPEKKDLTAIDQEVDPEAYEKAVAYNDSIDQKEMLLAMQAEDYRIKLNEQKKNIQLPKIEKEAQSTEAQQPTAEEIAEANRQWEALVSEEVPKISDLKFNVNGEEVKYKITETEKSALTETMKNFSAVDYLTKRGWFDEAGNPNVLKITEDVYQLENRDKMFSSVATKTKNATTKAVVADIKNVDLSRNGTSPEAEKVDAGTAVWG